MMIANFKIILRISKNSAMKFINLVETIKESLKRIGGASRSP